MICIVIKGPSLRDIEEQLTGAIGCGDLAELRFDHFTQINLQDIIKLRKLYSIPMIFTSKDKDEIRKLAALNPEYMDMESCLGSEFIREISHLHPDIKYIISHHDFEKTPEDLDAVYNNMCMMKASFYKLAVTAQNSKDALRLMLWAQTTESSIIAISMGACGQISRILAPVFGSRITYACLEDKYATAAGQLPPAVLIENYHYRSLSKSTAIYGLIGNPVDKSMSHETHNRLIQTLNRNAVYVKMPVQPAELNSFLKLAKKMPFHGLSVTMPLKEVVVPFLDKIDPEAKSIGAVNTIVFDKGRLVGYNTDGFGALNAIERKKAVRGCHLVIIGAGGAAKAIAYEAIRRGARITILNRNAEKARQIAEQFYCVGYGFDKINEIAEQGYDILVNSTPSMLPIPETAILQESLIMDIKTKPQETDLLIAAKKKHCQIVYGYEMFFEQAIGQFNLWMETKEITKSHFSNH